MRKGWAQQRNGSFGGRFVASAILLAASSALGCERDRSSAAPVAVTEAHGVLTLDLALVDVEPAHREVTLDTLKRRFHHLAPGRLQNLTVSASADALRLGLRLRVAPTCEPQMAMDTVDAMTELATLSGRFELHVLPSRAWPEGLDRRLRQMLGAHVTLHKPDGRPSQYILQGPASHLHRARERLQGWSPRPGFDMVAGLARGETASLYLVRSRPDLRSDSIVALTPTSTGLTALLSPAAQSRLGELIQTRAPTWGLIRVDHHAVDVVRLDDSDRLRLSARTFPGGRPVLMALLDHPPFFRALTVEARSAACRDRMGALRFSL